jgi:hypothetical protein
MRATLLDVCRAVDPGPCSTIVSDGFVSIAITANIDEGTAVEQKNARGNLCINRPARPKIKNYSVTVNFCGVDPDMYAMFSGQDVVLDANGDAIGFNVDVEKDTSQAHVALEAWSEIPGSVCSTGVTGADGVWGYTLLPALQNGVVGDFTIEDGAVNFSVSGMVTVNNAWDVGPYDVMLDGTGTPGPLLEAMTPGSHLRVFRTEVAPPDVACGCIELAA